MCGIAGYITHRSEGAKQINYEALVCNMLSEIKHRGPDESGIYMNEFAALGTVRLSIIDIKNGQQPMMARDRYVLNYNGEVFNYIELRQELETLGETFSTNSDTEVVLKSLIHWGPDALSKFDGHFAISFYDTHEEELLLARDPFGEKPLFYITNENFFAFGSEIKTFRALPDFDIELDQEKLSHIAWFWTSLNHESAFKNIHSVRPAHFIRMKDGSISEHRYFDFPKLNETNQSSANYKEAQDELRTLMQQSIERRLRSDVEVAAYLSGGLDSTIVTCLARDIAGHKLKTFSVTFDHPDYDESEFQESVANHLGTQHHTVKISNNDIVENFHRALEHAETPLFRTALVPMYLLSDTVQSAGIKVVLTGEGADEFFMGYDVFKETLFRESYPNYKNDADRIDAILNLYPYLPHFDSEKAAQLLQYFKNYTDTSGTFFSHDLRFANGTLANQLINNGKSRTQAEENLLDNLTHVADCDYKKQSKLAQAQITDIKTLLEGYLLSSQGDRMSSANSIEGRCPFLSIDIVKFAQNLPLNMKLSNGIEKKILRDTFADKIPEGNALRRKQPYRAPDALPFISNPEFLNDVITSNLLKDSNLIKADLAERFINKLLKKDKNNISPREDQAFIFMISTLMLEKSFAKTKTSQTNNTINLKVKIDETDRRKIA